MAKEKRYYFEEVPLPIMKARKVGNSLVYTIPNGVVKKYGIEPGDKILCVLIIRTQQFKYELKKNEEIVVMDKDELKEFRKYQEMLKANFRV